MTVVKLAKLVAENPRVIAAYMVPTRGGIQPLLGPEEREKALRRQVPMAADRINLAHDFDFNCHFVDMTSVADQAVYQCKGNNEDCRDIITIQYGEDADTLDTLKEYTPTDRDDRYNTMGASDVAFWSPYKRKGTFPQFELVAAPNEAGKMIRVRHRFKGVTVIDFPGEFDWLLNLSLLSIIVPEYETVFQNELGFMIKHHQGSGREDSRLRIDSVQEARNAHNSSLPGY